MPFLISNLLAIDIVKGIIRILRSQAEAYFLLIINLIINIITRNSKFIHVINTTAVIKWTPFFMSVFGLAQSQRLQRLVE